MRKQKRSAEKFSGRRVDLLAQEKGSYLKKWTGRLPVALVYPSDYAVGMSSLGFQLIYELLGSNDALVCERFFLPEPGQPLRSVESQRPLDHFPIICISISFEHDFANLVKIFELAGIEPLAVNREDSVSAQSPLIICGGVIAFMNPEPLAPFIDLFVIGEAEPVLPEIITTITGNWQNTGRNDLLLQLARKTELGCYVPRFYTPEYSDNGQLQRYLPAYDLPARITKVSLLSCKTAAHSQLLSPAAEFAEMHLTELGRGCSRGCRFCAAGYIYRPPRLWDGKAVVRGLQERHSSVSRVGLLGMEMADTESLGKISSYLRSSGCALSFSSLRADRLNEELLELLAASTLKSVAIAPDGSSERLRRVINKGLAEKDLLSAAERLVDAGIFKLKLYLMIGLPTETDDDLLEAVELVANIRRRIEPLGRARGRLTEIIVSVNCFTPKPWTPFQYHPFGISQRLGAGENGVGKEVLSELKRRQKLLQQGLKPLANVQLQLDKPDNVMFQAVLSRGDRKLAPVLMEMVKSKVGWKQAMKRNSLTAEEYILCDYDEDTYFPWYLIDHGVDTGFLWREYERAFAEKPTPACDTRICRRCGVCHD